MHTNKLIEQGLITAKQSQKFTVYTIRRNYTAHNELNTWTGYNYSFLINASTRCNGFLNYSFDNHELSHLRFFLTEDIPIEALKQFLKRKYGEPIFKTGDFKEDYITPTKIFIWLSGGKEVQLCEWENYSYIQYSNTKIRYDIENQNHILQLEKHKQDSLDNVNLRKEAEQSHKSF